MTVKELIAILQQSDPTATVELEAIANRNRYPIGEVTTSDIPYDTVVIEIVTP